jgi:hypothetical protein
MKETLARSRKFQKRVIIPTATNILVKKLFIIAPEKGFATFQNTDTVSMRAFRLILLTVFWGVFCFSVPCSAQDQNQPEIPTHYTYVPRKDSKPGDYKVVVVPAINPRQARLDAQTYHIGWDAIDARMGQSRVMYDVLLKKREPYVPGTLPIMRPIPKEKKGRARR